MKQLRIFILAYLAIVIVALAAFISHLIVTKVNSDFLMLYSGAISFFKGHSIYAPVPWKSLHILSGPASNQVSYIPPPIYQLGADYSFNLNPPIVELFFLPFAFCSYPQAIFIWSILIFLAGSWALAIIYRVYFQSQANIWGFLLLSGIFWGSFPACSNFILLQLGTLILLGVTGVWYWSRQGDDIKAGVLLGILLSAKYFLGLLVVFYFFQKRWRLVFFSLFSFIGANIIAYAVFGKTAYIQHLQILKNIVWYSNVWSASFYSYFGKLDANIVHNVYTMNPLGKWSYYVCSAIIIALQIYFCRAPIKSTREFDFNFSYALIASILICPLGWIYYAVFFILPIFWILEAISQETNYFSFYFMLAFAAMIGLLSFPTTIKAFANHNWKAVFLMYSPYFYGTLTLLALLVYVQKKRPILSVQSINTKELFPWVILVCLMVAPSVVYVFYTVFIKLT
ncbi:MAG: hypothetical protein K0S08_865 [Gammaproteobacteria bacterium]|nr:hypothetical protein [Gammaproteobacteria bacterium]